MAKEACCRAHKGTAYGPEAGRNGFFRTPILPPVSCSLLW